jgi:hypothetical protein
MILLNNVGVFLNWCGGFELDGPRWQPGAGPLLRPVG